MRTFKQAQFDVALRAKAQFELGNWQVTPPGAMTLFSHETDVLNIFSGLEREQNAVNEAIDSAFQVKDYGTLYDALDFLKFSRMNAEAIVGVAATAAGFISGVGAVISAVQTVSQLLRFMGATSSGGFNFETKVEVIGLEVNSIYRHLLGLAEEEMLEQAAEIRNSIGRSKDTMDSVRTTGLSTQSIKDLGGAIDRLDLVIGNMLSIPSGSIPFSYDSYKTVFGRSPWYQYSGTPYLKFANGSPTKKLTPLASHIWDAGHYIDALVAAIRLRISMGVTLEPLFRTTGYRRPALESMIPRLRAFIDHWRDSFMVAQPSDCILADGTITIYEQFGLGGTGLLIGTICPVTGISSLRLFNNFASKHITTSKGGWPFGPGTRKYKAIDPQRAVYDALIQHQIAVNLVKQACGLSEFEQLYEGLKDVAGPPHPTESVHFEAVKRVPTPTGTAQQDVPMPQPTTVDLGELKRFSVDPNKTYPATRFFTTGGKIVTMRVGRRATVSEVRTGYRIRISGELVDITKWESAPPPELANQIDWFPAESFETPLTVMTKVYDCVQTRTLTAGEEESYDESGDAGNTQRLLINERQATVNVKVRLDFTPLADGDNKAHIGEIRLTFTPDDVLDQPHAYLLDIDVLETHVKSTGPVLEEVTVEGLSLHIVPSWLKVSTEFLDDYQDALERMFKAMLGTALGRHHRQQLSPDDVPKFVDPRPKYLTIQEASTVALTTKMFELAERDARFAAEVEKFLIPQGRR